jgi:glycosyltransferase 2 family protein
LSTQTTRLRPVERTNKFRTWAIIAIANVLSLVCLIWVLKNAGLQRIGGEIRHMKWSWVCMAVLCDVAVYLIHGWRWKLTLRPVAQVPYLQTIEAIYVGLFTNEVFPLRAGELIRCFLLSKSTDVSLSLTFASAVIERIFDGIWLLVFFLVSMELHRLSPAWMFAGYLLTFVISVLALVLGYAMYARRQSLDLVFGLAWPNWFNKLIDDLHLIGHSRYLYYAFMVSGLYLGAQFLPIYGLVQAYNLNVPWTASLIAMVLLRLSAIVPQAPGNLGSFQAVATRAMILFGLDGQLARRFSIVLWAGVTIPLIVIGFIAVTAEGYNMSHLHRDATSAAKERQRVA